MSTSIAHDIRQRVLAPVMDARALNLDQARRIARLDTPERDSMIERLRGLRDRPLPRHPDLFVVTGEQIRALEQDAWFLAECNGREGQCERRAAGAAEIIAARAQLPRDGISRRRSELARRLRPILRALDDRSNPMRWVRAGRDLGRLLDAVPESTLRAARMERELGRRLYGRLCSTLDQLEAGRVV